MRERGGCTKESAVPSSALSDTGWSGFGSWPERTQAAASASIHTTPGLSQTPPVRGTGTDVRGIPPPGWMRTVTSFSLRNTSVLVAILGGFLNGSTSLRKTLGSGRWHHAQGTVSRRKRRQSPRAKGKGEIDFTKVWAKSGSNPGGDGEDQHGWVLTVCQALCWVLYENPPLNPHRNL